MKVLHQIETPTTIILGNKYYSVSRPVYEFDKASVITPGTIVAYSNKLFTCIKTLTGDFNPSHFTELPSRGEVHESKQAKDIDTTAFVTLDTLASYTLKSDFEKLLARVAKLEQAKNKAKEQ